jgi:hypothetical protein
MDARKRGRGSADGVVSGGGVGGGVKGGYTQGPPRAAAGHSAAGQNTKRRRDDVDDASDDDRSDGSDGGSEAGHVDIRVGDYIASNCARAPLGPRVEHTNRGWPVVVVAPLCSVC